MKILVEAEIAAIRDRRIADHIRKFLGEPHIVWRGWDYGEQGQQYPCWTVADDGHTAIACCEHGFGPQNPWGLVSTKEADNAPSMGMDCGWFMSFRDAFLESLLIISLPIWQVLKCHPDSWKPAEAITDELEWSTAWQKCYDLRASDPDSRYVV